MSLQLVAGGSGSGKSWQLYKKILEEAEKHPELNYLIIVPEQFTLQTQKDIVALSPVQGILNIDVLSFHRLAHRIFEEVGYQNTRGTLIDDMGKNLILRRLAGQFSDQLPTLGAGIHKIGYISEIKSVLSEFMQYGIGEEEQKKLIALAKDRPLLQEKLKELHTLYNIFNDFIREKYVTGEELLEKVSYCIPDSNKIKSGVISFDGFTGFTPVQNRIIQALLENSKKVFVTILTDNNAMYDNGVIQEHELFYLSKKTINSLKKMAKRSGIEIEPVFFIDSKVPARYFYPSDPKVRNDLQMQGNPENTSSTEKVKNPKLIFLERNLFRDGGNCYDGPESEDLELFSGADREEEVVETALRIRELIQINNYRYHNIAVITGDINLYYHVFERIFTRYDIPFFIDRSLPVLMNPFTEFIRAAIDVLSENFSYSAVMRYLRSSLTDFETDRIDRLENYLLAFGIKGRSMWTKPFTKCKKTMDPDELIMLNEVRERICSDFLAFEEELTEIPITEGKKGNSRADTTDSVYTVRKLAAGLYHFIERNESYRKLSALAEELYEKGEEGKAKESEQIYQRVMELLDQLVELLGEEQVTIREFAELLNAGFDEIRIGVIPKSQDYVQIGDLTRSRLRKVKALFLVGVNDGIVPSVGGKGGLISELDREFLSENEDRIDLAPTKRQQAFTQRLYLYMMVTKPAERLYISWSELNQNGESLKPSYFIKIICDMFPKQQIDLRGHLPEERIFSEKTAILELSKEIRTYIQKTEKPGQNTTKNDKNKYLTLFNIFQYNNTLQSALRETLDTSFTKGVNSYQTQIDRAIARAIYGTDIVGSITRLERYAACAYSHFLTYGLNLRERDEFSFEARNLGSAFHDALMQYGALLKENKLAWIEPSEEKRRELATKAVEQTLSLGDYGAIYGSYRSSYMKERLKRLLNRSVDTLTAHLRQGEFTPVRYEYPFHLEEDCQTFRFSLSEDESLSMIGRIDRIDFCEDEGHIYVKVLDYKSGDEKFMLSEVYEGLSLQLTVYLTAALEYAARRNPKEKEILPAGTFYYHIDDPIVELKAGEEEEKTRERVQNELRMRGLVNSDENIYTLLDKELKEDGHSRSDIIPIRIKSDHTLYADSSAVSTEDFHVLSEFTKEKLKELGTEILAGNINAARKEADKSEDCCRYCLYQTICKRKGVSASEKTTGQSKSRDEILALMREKTDGRS